MAERKQNTKLMFILLGILGLVVGGAAFALIGPLTNGSDNPEGVGKLLGQIGGGAMGVGAVFLILGILKKKPE